MEIDSLVVSTLENNTQAYVSVIVRDDYEPLDLRGKTKTQVLETLRAKSKYLGEKIPGILSSLSEEDFKLRGIYVFNDGFYGNITKKGLEKLRRNPSISRIYLNTIGQYILTSSVPLINATSVWTIQVSGKNITGLGTNTTVCIIDSGINYSHPDLGGCNVTQNISDGTCSKIIGGYDYYDSDSNPMDLNGHGTHIAGIVAANSYVKGVAPYARIVALRNGNTTPDYALTKNSVQWCINNSDYYNISIITISSDLSDFFRPPTGDANCYPNDDLSKAIETAKQAGIFVVVASGNKGYTDKIAFPACTNATSVGATYDGNVGNWTWEDAICDDQTTSADQIGCGSNRAGILDLLAPGAPIYSTYYDGSYATYYGTSQAAPHVAGAAVLLIQYEELKNNRTLTPAQIEQRFKDTGKLVFDNSTNLNFSRIDVYAALFPIDVFDLQRLNASTNYNIFGFKIQNNYNNQTKNISWFFDIGNGTTITSTNITLPPKKNAFIYFEYNYTDGDVYSINATASSGEDSDSEIMIIPIGNVIAYDMKLLNSSSRERIFGFNVLNNMNNSGSVNWTLNTGQQMISSSSPTYLNSSKTVFVYVGYNYTASGTYTVNATAINDSLTDYTRNIEVNVS